MKLRVDSAVMVAAALAACRSDRIAAHCPPQRVTEDDLAAAIATIGVLDPTQDVFFAPPVVDRALDLEPLDRGDQVEFAEYHALVRETLLGGRDAELELIAHSGFEPEYALSLRHATASDGTPTWVLELAVGTQQIWHAEPVAGTVGAMRPELRRGVAVDRREIELDDATADALCDAWHAVVRRTRCPRPQYDLVDGRRTLRASPSDDRGTVYEFACGAYCGKTCAPQTGVPAELVALAQALREALLLPPASRAEPVRACKVRAEELAAKAEALPW